MFRADFVEVFGNLIDNARKWAASRVDIRADAENDTVVLEVIDTVRASRRRAAPRGGRRREAASA
jgi:hypothetical protein